MRTALITDMQQGGLYAIQDVALHPGANVLFVDSTHASKADLSGAGRDPEHPLATLDYAIGLCTADKGDTIYLMPGHAETITAASGAGSLTADIAGIRIIGLGRGSKKPTLTLGTLIGATLNVTAPNVVIRNTKIISALADITAGITASAAADGLVVDGDCEFTDGSAILELVIGISLAAGCDGVRIENNHFFTVDGGGCASAIKFVGESLRSIVRNNRIHGDYSAAGIDGITAAATQLLIEGNKIWNTDTTAGLAINLHGSTTGIVTDNRLIGFKTNTVPLVAAGCADFENYTTAAVNESGAIKPAIETFA
jgi:nitrous oxidase accessory protein NosD